MNIPIWCSCEFIAFTDTGFGTTGGFGTSAFGTTTNTGGLFGSAQNKPGLLTVFA